MSEIKVGDKVEVVELDPVVDVGHFEVGDVLIVRKVEKELVTLGGHTEKLCQFEGKLVGLLASQLIKLEEESNKKTTDVINDKINPPHYQKYKLEMFDNMQNSMTHEEFTGYLKGNVMKYLARYKDKSGVEDLNKAKRHIEKLIEVEYE